MFYLSKIEHTMRVPPHLLNIPLEDAIKLELENIFLDKVISNSGLCISIYDIQAIKGGFIFPSDGASTYTVVFRMVMFRPFVGEVIIGKVKESNEDGLRLTLGFFEDIYVPVHLLPKPPRSKPDPYQRNKVQWIWDYEGQEFAIDDTDQIRFRVANVSYPSIPIEQPEQSKPFAPMVITGLLDYDGLGPVSWWNSFEEIDPEEEEEAA